MFDILGVAREGLKLASTLSSGENSEKRFSVAMRKDARKALNVAEEIFDIVDDYMEEFPIKARRKLKKLIKKFDSLD